VTEERTIDLQLVAGVAVRVSHAGRPIERYSVVLLAWEDGAWQTIRVFDNHQGTHHMHRYTRSQGKQAPALFHSGTTNEAIAAAIAHLKDHWEAIIQVWAS
jgi:hypothetical protein